MKTEAILEDAEDLYQNAPFGYLTLRVDGLIINANNTILAWLGYKRSEVVFQKSFQDLLGMGEKIYYETHIMPMLQIEGEISEINVELKGKEPIRLPVLVNAKRIAGQKKSDPSYRLSVLDITQRKQYEVELMKAKKEAEQSVKRLKQIKEDLEQFAYVVVHDLKAPLRSIIGLLGIVKKKGDNMDAAQKEHYLNVVTTAAEDMNKLIDNVLEYARSSNEQEEMEEVKVIDLFRKQELLFGLELLRVNGRMEVTSSVSKIEVYPILFQRLLTNLISNAIKYRSDIPPVIQLSCEEEKEHIVFALKDNGIGIPENQFETIFTLFKSLKPNDDSNGIGLSICKKIVELHEGKIWLESSKGTGSTFYFSIPKNNLNNS